MNNCTIAHIDLDAFYASVECLNNPEIRNLPVAVSGSIEDRHGIILAKNQIAKRFGVKTGETIIEAKRKCKNLVFVKANFSHYVELSKIVKDIYRRYTDQVESFGIDEAWIDLSKSTKLFGNPENIVKEIQDTVFKETGLTVSIGLSFNKAFAKLGSDQNKPNGLFIITEDNFKEKIWHLPVSDLLYVGKSTTKKLHLLNIKTIGDLANSDPNTLSSYLGKNGKKLHSFANGKDNSIVTKTTDQHLIKSIGNSLTLPKDLNTNDEVLSVFHMLSESVGRRLRKQNLKCKCIHISIRDKNLSTTQIQMSINTPTFISGEIANHAFSIFKKKYKFINPIRSLGVTAVDLVPEEQNIQLNLLSSNEKREKMENLEKTIDAIRDNFGYDKIQKGILLVDTKLTSRNIMSTNIIFPPGQTH